MGFFAPAVLSLLSVRLIHRIPRLGDSTEPSFQVALLLGIVVAPSAVMMTIISRLDPSVAAYRGTFGLLPILLLLLTVIAIILLQVYRKNDLPKRREKYKGR